MDLLVIALQPKWSGDELTEEQVIRVGLGYWEGRFYVIPTVVYNKDMYY